MRGAGEPVFEHDFPPGSLSWKLQRDCMEFVKYLINFIMFRSGIRGTQPPDV